VAVNFRLHGRDGATLDDMTDDIAKALKWLTVNVRKFGGRSSGFILVGYSSGAHLAALMATDPARWGTHSLSPDVIAGVMGIDVPFYDVGEAMSELQARAEDGPQEAQRFLAAREIMGITAEEHARVSPAAHLGPWMSHIRFLLLSAGSNGGRFQDLSRAMSAAFAQRLKAMQVAAKHEHFPVLDHIRALESFETLRTVAAEDFLQACTRVAA
jgi:acetyl esterase/lipase